MVPEAKFILTDEWGSPLTLIIKTLPPGAPSQRNRDGLVKIKVSKPHPAKHLKDEPGT